MTSMSDREQYQQTAKFPFFNADYHAIFANSPVPQLICKLDGTVVKTNPASIKLLKLSSDRLLGSNIETIIPSIRKPELDYWQQIQTIQQVSYQTDYSRPDLAKTQLRISLVPIDLSSEKYILLTIVSVSATALEIQQSQEFGVATNPSEFTKFALDSITSGILCVDPQGKIVFVNQAICQRLGYSSAELYSMTIFDVDASFNPQTQVAKWAKHWQDIQQRKTVFIESRHRTKTGEIFPVEVTTNYFEFEQQQYNFALIRDISDRINTETILKNQIERELLQTSLLNQKNQQLEQEITERQQIEEQLRQSQQLLQLVLDTIPQQVFWKDRDSVYLGCNKLFANAAGLESPEQIIGKIDSELPWTTEETKPYLECDRRIIADNRPEIDIIESQLNAAGEQTWLKTSKSPLHDAAGNVIGILGTFQDITPLKEAEQTLQRINEDLEQRVEERTQKLEESQQFLQIVIDTIPHCIFWKDRDLVYAGCNLRFAEAAGFTSPEAVRGKTDCDLPWTNENAYLLLKSDHLVMDLEFPELMTLEPQVQEDGTTIWLESHKVPLYNSEDETIGILGTFQDITKHKQAEESLKQLNLELQQAIAKADAANQAKSDFLANMSHELRTPLNGILGYAQILLSNPATTKKEKQIFRTIEKCGSHLLTLINDILDLSKIEVGKLELLLNDFHLAKFLEDIGAMCRINAEQKDLAFSIDLPPTIPEIVHGDEKRLRQVLINLLGNAIKFTDCGQVTLKVSEIKYIKETQDDRLPQIILRFDVMDTGIGIPSQQLHKIFQAFEQVGDCDRQGEGTGLGLAISKQLLELMNGELCVVSTPDVGSTFWFELSLLVVSQHHISTELLPSTSEATSPQFSPQPPKPKMSLALVAPPPEEIQILYELAMLGSMKKIRQRAKYLEQLDPRYTPLAQKLQELAQGFQEKAILNLIEQYR